MKKLQLILFFVCCFVLANAQTDKQIPFFSLLKKSQSEVENTLGKPTKKTLVHRGSDSYDGYLYRTKNAEYSIAFRNGNAFVVVATPLVKQPFSEDALFDGGVFDVENERLGGTMYRPVSGKKDGVAYWGMSTGENSYQFYSKNGSVSRAVAF